MFWNFRSLGKVIPQYFQKRLRWNPHQTTANYLLKGLGWWFTVRFFGSFLRRFFRGLVFIDVVAWASEAPKKGTVKLCIFFIFRVWAVTLFIFTIHWHGELRVVVFPYSEWWAMKCLIIMLHAYWDGVDFRSRHHHRHRRHHKMFILLIIVIVVTAKSSSSRSSSSSSSSKSSVSSVTNFFLFFLQPNHESNQHLNWSNPPVSRSHNSGGFPGYCTINQ